MTDRNRDYGRTRYGNSPRQSYNEETQGYRNDQNYWNRANRDWGYGEYPENYSFGPTDWYYEEYWFVPGPYVGVGPQGYQRSDEDIRDTVCERLAQNGRLDASNMHVDVNNGEVTLKGTVDSRNSKRLAEDIADSVYGVTDVHNDLRISKQVQPGTGQSMAQRMQAPKPANLREGQEVVGKMDHKVGTVKEIHNHDFVLNRPAAPDVHVPFSEIQDTTKDRVRLNVTAEQIDQQGWTHI